MDIHSLMQKFTELGYVTVGRGPKHPESPSLELQKEIDSFLEQYSFLRKDPGYIDFLEYYSGAMVDWPKGELVIAIFGFLEEISFHLIKDGGEVIDDDGFYAFCTSVVRVGEGQDMENESIGLGYTFDATGTRRWGVYRSIEGGECEWYCDSFLEWLEKLIDKNGLLV
ncbi:hypothetical protein Cylst_5903 [Cylindrospermum stagnale PCC 7417]|uniref:Knr4/Smi1-like domain-containing protein n=1 Tax=Cylindrospermum stagnale PCC 7417 TaxID=56107 RepID=K9X5E2_9NOST|nr:hypothetical protein [Cylindrospermum stagnale]AFZ27880.1 hypothetical protein Cylst_5903 [Cylindrospermum stagnale PCC 7417]